jgi:Thioredoxin/Thioredoxin-like domain
VQTKFVQPSLEQASVQYSGKKLRVDSLAAFIKTKAAPAVGELTHVSEPLYEAQDLPVLTLFLPVDAASPQHIKHYTDMLVEVAKQYRGKILATVASAINQREQFSNFKISLHGRPDMVLGIRDNDMHYSEVTHRDLSKEDILRFTKGVMEGQLEGRYVDRSPEKADVVYDNTAVVSLTEDSFNDVVTYSGKHALVVFYAPWCGVCKALRPDLIQAAKLLRSDERVVIAAMDVEAQGVPAGFKIEVLSCTIESDAILMS